MSQIVNHSLLEASIKNMEMVDLHRIGFVDCNIFDKIAMAGVFDVLHEHVNHFKSKIRIYFIILDTSLFLLTKKNARKN